ncbi:battenin-like isoform X2 [Culicoides brevitarsis]|uniref:battenin-like isoform X2 n=1 Tax=Culicoides brevitarsis TaxID=469753 RepID=UPI00307B3EC4
MSETASYTSNSSKKGLWRDLSAYWILGLCNNFGYVVMLTAAHDIIHDLSEGENGPQTDPDFKRECNKLSTGAILLADIVPAFIRMTFVVLLSIVSLLLVAYAKVVWIALFGVILTSLSAGLGEVTLLSYTSRFNKNTVSTWSSGTGGAGVFASLSYSTMRQAGLSTKTSLLIMLCVPVVQSLVFIFLLKHPSSDKNYTISLEKIKNLNQSTEDITENDANKPLIGFSEKLRYIPSLFKYIIPLFLVNIFEYVINQGFFELIYFENSFLDHKAQYRWYQVTHNVGIFIARSSVNLFRVRWLWLMAIFQGIDVLLFSLEAVFWLSPSIWIVFALTFWEGLLGGCAYVNTFYRISEEVPAAKRIFAISITAFSKTAGIASAGWIAMPTHNAICKIPTPNRGF